MSQIPDGLTLVFNYIMSDQMNQKYIFRRTFRKVIWNRKHCVSYTDGPKTYSGVRSGV